MQIVKISGQNERGNSKDTDCYNITINILICYNNISALQTRRSVLTNIATY